MTMPILTTHSVDLTTVLIVLGIVALILLIVFMITGRWRP
jgi:hypothetical protein